MAEETEGQDTGAEAIAGGVDPAAMALALAGAGREEANTFLQQQGALIADQRHHLHVQLRQVYLGIWKEYLGVLLRVATAIMGLAIAIGLAWMVWGAAHSEGLVIEPFSVPPDLAQRGLTGQVVAAKLLDHLSEMQTQTSSQRSAKSYANDWSSSGIKVDIPETGVSLKELENFLREKLGHDTHISGEVISTASGIEITARAGDEHAASVTGNDAELDGLILKLSESIYKDTQPYRFAIYLVDHGRSPEAIPLLQDLVRTGAKVDRMYSYNRLALAMGVLQGRTSAVTMWRKAVTEDPDNIGAWMNLVTTEMEDGKPRSSLNDAHRELSQLLNPQQQYLQFKFIPDYKRRINAAIDYDLGAFGDAAQIYGAYSRSGMPGVNAIVFSHYLSHVQARAHDIAAARAELALHATDDSSIFSNDAYQILVESAAQEWTAVLSLSARTKIPFYAGNNALVETRSYAEAKLGMIADAEAHIAATPGDCDDCLITRAKIAELRGQHARADWWFARAEHEAPSIPFADAEWGQALMVRGNYDGAITKFTLANQKGPHFADPLEAWGETLMLQRHPDQALAKFEEAEKYAPNWGRLHLKWGEALWYAGKRDDARAQFARAAQLDLTPSEKSELARHP